MKKLYVWEVSLQVTTPASSKPNLKHQLNYTVQATEKGEAVTKAEGHSKADGNTVVSVVSTVRKRLVK